MTVWAFILGLVFGVALAAPIAWLATRRGVHRVRELTRRAQAAERLAELGTLTGGLAHEIKNPLSTLGLNVQLLQEDLHELAEAQPEGSDLRERLGRTDRRLQSLQREAQRLREILEDFLRFAGRMKLDREAADVNALLDEVTDFFQPQADVANVTLRAQLTANPPTAWIDGGLIKQAVLNLLINATQAMTRAREQDHPHGGADLLILRTERVRRIDQEHIVIHVTDTGPGIEPDNVSKVFQPYFSTRRGGTGLGLPTTRRIAEEHGGTLTVHSEPGRGSDFVISVPAEAPKESVAVE